MSRANRDIPACAILNRRWFLGLESLEQVPGTCAREEGLRILTSPRREASLFKLGRTFGFGQFLLRNAAAWAACSKALRIICGATLLVIPQAEGPRNDKKEG